MKPIRVKSMHYPDSYGNIVAFVYADVRTLAIVVWDGGGITEDVLHTLQVMPQTIGNAELAMQAAS